MRQHYAYLKSQRQFREVDTNNDFLISFDEIAILAKAYQDKINAREGHNSQIVKSNDQSAPATALKKKNKPKNQLNSSKLLSTLRLN